MAKTTSRPTIGKRALNGAKQALAAVTLDAALSLEKRIQVVDDLVIGIRDEIIDVQAAILLFQKPQRWVSAMQTRGISRGSQFSYYLQKTIVVASMQSLCRLWDPRQKKYTKFGFCDLLMLLTDDVMEALEKRALEKLWEYGPETLFYEREVARFKSLRSDLIAKIDALRVSYNGCEQTGVSCSVLKATRDKWIAHNDVGFDKKTIDHALTEVLPFFDDTKRCFEHINAFVRDASFSWESVIIPIERDIAAFLGETPLKAPVPSSWS